MPFTGQELLRCVLHRVERSCRGVASFGLIVGDCVMEGDDKQYGAKKLGAALDLTFALDGDTSGERSLMTTTRRVLITLTGKFSWLIWIPLSTYRTSALTPM